jgi:soluble epoxide hydrolase/lipid-phosphate phosphatase
MLLSRVVNYFPERLLCCAFLSVPYAAPGQKFDLDMMKGLTESMLSFEKFGYMRFMEREDSGSIFDQHVCVNL